MSEYIKILSEEALFNEKLSNFFCTEENYNKTGKRFSESIDKFTETVLTIEKLEELVWKTTFEGIIFYGTSDFECKQQIKSNKRKQKNRNGSK